jgi:hypothetical protein
VTRESKECPNCKATLDADASHCRACGANSETPGWSSEDGDRPLERPDLPQTHLDDEEYDEFVRDELGGDEIQTSPPSRTTVFLIVLLVLGVAAILALLTTRK